MTYLTSRSRPWRRQREVPVLKAVVFDMDDTLLSINLSAFIAVFARDEAALLADIARKSPLSCSRRLAPRSTPSTTESATMMTPTWHSSKSRSSAGAAFPLSDPVIADVLTYYEREILPGKNDGIINARPREGAREASMRSPRADFAARCITKPQLQPRVHRVPHGLGRYA